MLVKHQACWQARASVISPRQNAPQHRTKAIIKPTKPPAPDPHVLALDALAWILAEERRAQRFLDLTGLTPAELRASAAQVTTHRAVLDFLCAHEPDLLAASEALATAPENFATARERLAS